MDSIDVAVIILNWKDYQTTKTCLRRLQDSTTQKAEIIVVDNEATNPDEFSEFDCHVVINHENRGFAGGCNDGLEKAKDIGADVVCFFNNDAFPENDFLTPLTRILSDPTIGAVGGVIYEGSSNNIWFGVGEWYPQFVRTNSCKSPKGTEETDWITGCLFAARVETLCELGGFDERYFLYLEDVDLSRRIKNEGYQLVTTSQSQVRHDVGGSLNESQGPSSVRAYYMARNRVLFANAHFQKSEKIHALILSSALSVAWALKLVADGQLRQAVDIGRGLIDGFLGRQGRRNGYP